jgi:hypothetical protein
VPGDVHGPYQWSGKEGSDFQFDRCGAVDILGLVVLILLVLTGNFLCITTGRRMRKKYSQVTPEQSSPVYGEEYDTTDDESSQLSSSSESSSDELVEFIRQRYSPEESAEVISQISNLVSSRMNHYSSRHSRSRSSSSSSSELDSDSDGFVVVDHVNDYIAVTSRSNTTNTTPLNRNLRVASNNSTSSSNISWDYHRGSISSSSSSPLYTSSSEESDSDSENYGAYSSSDDSSSSSFLRK